MGRSRPGGSLAPDCELGPTVGARKERACAASFSTPMSGPLSAGVPATGNLTDDVVRNAAEAPERPWCSPRRLGEEEWHDVTTAEFLEQGWRGVAKGLVAAGIAPGRPG